MAHNETVENMVNLLTRQGRLQDAYDLVVTSLEIDPYSKILNNLKTLTKARLKAKKELPQLEEQLQLNPSNRPTLAKILQDFLILGQQKNIDLYINNAIKTNPNDITFLREIINFYANQGRLPQALGVAETLFKVQPAQWDVPIIIAKYQLLLGKQQASLESLKQAIAIGGTIAAENINTDPIFQRLHQLPEYQELLKAYKKS